LSKLADNKETKEDTLEAELQSKNKQIAELSDQLKNVMDDLQAEINRLEHADK